MPTSRVPARAGLSALQDSVDRAIDDVRGLPRGILIPRYTSRATEVASLGETLLVDTRYQACRVRLPSIQQSKFGHGVGIKQYAGANGVTIYPPAGVTIDGESSYSLAERYGYVEMRPVSDDRYIALAFGGNGGGGGGGGETVLSDSQVDGGSGVYDAANGVLTSGFLDEFPGGTLHPRWSVIGSLGGSSYVAVNDGYLEISDDGGSAGSTGITASLLPHVPFDFFFFWERVSSDADQSLVVRVRGPDDARIGFDYIDAGGQYAGSSDFVRHGFQVGGTTNNGISESYSWMRAWFDGANLIIASSSNTSSIFPVEWTNRRRNDYWDRIWMPSEMQILCHQFSDTPGLTATYRIRRLHFRYL